MLYRDVLQVLGFLKIRDTILGVLYYSKDYSILARGGASMFWLPLFVEATLLGFLSFTNPDTSILDAPTLANRRLTPILRNRSSTIFVVSLQTLNP